MKKNFAYRPPTLSHIPYLPSIPAGEIQEAARAAKAPGETAGRVLQSRHKFGVCVAASLAGETWVKLSGTPAGEECIRRLVDFSFRYDRISPELAAAKIGYNLMTSREERDRLATIKDTVGTMTLYSRDKDKSKRWFFRTEDTYARNISPLGYPLHTVSLSAAELIAAKLIQPDRFEVVLTPWALKRASVTVEAA